MGPACCFRGHIAITFTPYLITWSNFIGTCWLMTAWQMQCTLFDHLIFFFNCFWLWTNSILLIIEKTFEIDGDRDDNGVVRGQRMGFSSLLRMVLFCPLPAPPRMTEKTFSPHPRPLGPREAPSHPVELYFLLVCPTTSTIFLMKPISLIKIYLKLQLNWSHQIQSIFIKKIE